MIESKFQFKGGFHPYLSVSRNIKAPAEITLEPCLQKAMLKSSFLGLWIPWLASNTLFWHVSEKQMPLQIPQGLQLFLKLSRYS